MKTWWLMGLAAGAALAQPAPHMPAYPRVDDTAGYKVDANWPQEKPPGGEWTAAMSSVAIAPDGNVWTFNRGKIPVQVYTPEGRLVKSWGEGGLFKNPHTVRFDNAGNLWLVDTGTNTVRRFTTDGKVLMTIGTPDQAGADETHLNQPNDVAVAANGDVYISDGYGNDRVVVFDKRGKFVRTWGKLGTGPGEFSQPHSLVLDSKGRVYVADRNNSRIQVFDAKGKFLTEWKNIITPWALFITKNDEIYVCGSSPTLWSEIPASQTALATPPKDQLFLKLDTEGRLKQLWAFPRGENGKEKPGQVNWIHSMAVAADGSLYFAEVQAKRAEKFVPAGTQVPVLSSSR
ncbi:MAG TPA: peptidyl-alpha-hydroxyglycine alpha-amidating lyase family protein [Bryobacteraceae bacterium]|jgi:DNA-binding beta-propeller fold protein YncE|nr:peptidyl-alpha-hydroxyglycine alpha-amidating lyase family protein [Bryobacteraceae bacterium]